MSAVVCCQADSACDRWRRRTSHDLEVERGTLAAIVKGTRHPGWDSQLGCRIEQQMCCWSVLFVMYR